MQANLKNKIEKILSDYPNADEKEIFNRIEKVLQDVRSQYAHVKESKSIAELTREKIKNISLKKNLENVIKTGFLAIDSSFGGFLLGELNVIAARPGMGKTQFMVNLALNISKTQPVLYFTFDLPEEALSSRFISALSGYSNSKMLQLNFSIEEEQQLLLAEEKLKESKIFINDSCNHIISAFKAECEKQIKTNNVKVIFVDCIQMMGQSKYYNNREFEVSFICRELKNIAKHNNVCVIISSQLNRMLENRAGGAKRPMFSDIRESGSIEYIADKVIFLYRPAYYGFEVDENNEPTKNRMEVIFAKNRRGALGEFKLFVDEHFTKFSEFDNSKNDFNFSEDRLNEMVEKNPNIKNMIDKLDLGLSF
ncbi:MAG: DnaB-like helicase C-terminal domain-containing protein [Bacteroidetes bacterium]|nr:DnaB-like helicase C-terminal domain-containing protein [Bacteroidota bacterium]